MKYVKILYEIYYVKKACEYGCKLSANKILLKQQWYNVKTALNYTALEAKGSLFTILIYFYGLFCFKVGFLVSSFKSFNR